jgi:hypothetical protein
LEWIGEAKIILRNNFKASAPSDKDENELGIKFLLRKRIIDAERVVRRLMGFVDNHFYDDEYLSDDPEEDEDVDEEDAEKEAEEKVKAT